MIPLGWQFFEFRSSYVNDLISVWSNGAWNLNPSMLCLARWSLYFNPFNHNQTRIAWYGCVLIISLWNIGIPHPRILFEIVGVVGTPILIDENPKNHSFGHYTCVLVDINLVGVLLDSLWVERDEFAFDIKIEYDIISRQKAAFKNDHAKKKITQDLVPKKHVDEVQGCNKIVADEDPIIFYLIRSRR